MKIWLWLNGKYLNCESNKFIVLKWYINWENFIGVVWCFVVRIVVCLEILKVESVLFIEIVRFDSMVKIIVISIVYSIVDIDVIIDVGLDSVFKCF